MAKKVTRGQAAGGRRMIRYTQAKPVPMAPSLGYSKLVEAVRDHVEKHIGKIESVLHEIIPSGPHIDVHFVSPTKDRKFSVLVTSGMSNTKMKVSKGEKHGTAYAELFCMLPPSLKFSEESASGSSSAEEYSHYHWVPAAMRMLARLPAEFDAWFDWGHSVPNGDEDPPQAFDPSVRFNCWLFVPPLTETDDFHHLSVGKKRVRLLQMLPMCPEETEMLLEEGASAVLDTFGEAQIAVEDLFRADRRNAALRSKGKKGRK
jgi:hypothetical protein